MILQRHQPVAVWGWADPGETVTIEFAGQAKSINADDSGKWTVMLDPMPACAEPQTLRTGTIDVKDVLVGDVFQVSGQSNAAMSMDSCRRYPGTSGDIDSTTIPQVRILEAPWGIFRDRPQQDLPEGCAWKSLHPAANAGFSALAFYFARDLHRHLNVPVGIVRASHAGGMAEIKMPVEALLSYEGGQRFHRNAMQFFEANKDKPLLTGREKPGKDGLPPEPQPDGSVNGRYPASDWNGVIAPVIRYGKRGVIWYQGEHNAGNSAAAYEETLSVLIRSWREAYGDQNLPFIVIQLPRFDAGKGWAEIREAQAQVVRKTRKTGLVVTLDCGEKDSIHPADKKLVAERVALEARRLVYGEPVTGCEPLPDGHSVSNEI